jgi:LPXTG-site transpeptidase (sortase) family protein
VWRWALRWCLPFGHDAAVVSTRRLRIAVMGGAAALVVAASILTNTINGPDHQSTVTQPSVTASRTPPAARTAQTRSSTPVPHPPATRKTPTKPAQPAQSPNEAAPTPSADSRFSLVVKTQSGDISANVSSRSVASNEPVDPPHNTAEQWNTAAWVKQSSYPSTPSNGTSYVYGHACHYHVCPFTRLKDANVGDQVTVTTASGTLMYRIEKIGLSPKAATSLPSWASDSSVPNRLVLVTCAYEQGDTSRDNIVVVAQLQDA